MIRILKKYWLLVIEVAVAVTFFVVLVRPVSDQGGGTVPVIALLFGGTSIALHRVRPALAFSALALETLTLLAFGFGGRTAPLEMWAGAPLVLFSAAFFGHRITMIVSLAAGIFTWLAFTARSVSQTMFMYLGNPDTEAYGQVPLPDALLINSQSIVLSAVALIAPPVLGAALRSRFRRARVESAEPEGVTFAEFARERDLSAREQRVFELAARGLTNPEIAAELHLSEATVKSHMTRVLAKVRARDRVQLAIDAHSRGLFSVVIAGDGSQRS